MIKCLKDFLRTLFNTEPIKTINIPIWESNSTICMWGKLKQKALSENNEVNNQILRMMAEIELEKEVKYNFYIHTNNICK